MVEDNQKVSAKRSLVPAERRRRAIKLIRETGSVTVAALEAEFGISPMTARRDLAILEQEGRVQRTHGGAILPGFAAHEDSFQHRMEEAPVAKERLARAVTALLRPGETIFLDSSTTAYYAVRQILAESLPVTLLTNCVPIMELVADKEAPHVDVVGMGGSMRKLTRSTVGPHTVRTVMGHFADKTLLSINGLTAEGHLTDPDTLEAEVKRAMIEHSDEPILLVDGSKFEHRSLSVVAHVSDMARVLAADAPEDRLRSLAEMGAEIVRV